MYIEHRRQINVFSSGSEEVIDVVIDALRNHYRESRFEIERPIVKSQYIKIHAIVSYDELTELLLWEHKQFIYHEMKGFSKGIAISYLKKVNKIP